MASDLCNGGRNIRLVDEKEYTIIFSIVKQRDANAAYYIHLLVMLIHDYGNICCCSALH